MRKRGPVIIIVSLIVILVFIVGVRYGQRVETTNAITQALLSLAPSPSPAPSPEPIGTIAYRQGCGIEFLIPEALTVIKESSYAATLERAGQQVLLLSCESNIPSASESPTFDQIKRVLDDPQAATVEVELTTRTVPVRSAQWNDISVFAVRTRHPKTAQFIDILIEQSLFPLFSRTLTFE